MKFVILDHHPPTSGANARCGERHFDIMFEVPDQEKLVTFAVSDLPGRAKDVAFAKLDDHRAAYLDYEGPVSNNRGVVERFAFGQWSGELDADVLLRFDIESKHFAGASWTIRLDCGKLLRVT